MISFFLSIAIGSISLVFGGHWLVSSCVQLAYRIGITPALASATIVAIGTSFPEISVCLFSVAETMDVAVGNILGSNVQNIAIVLGISCLIYPPCFKNDGALHQWVLSLFASVLAFLLLSWPVLHPFGGACLLLTFCFTLFDLVRKAPKVDPNERTTGEARWSTMRAVSVMITGLACLVLGARAVLFGAVGIANSLGVSQQVVGLTIVAYGTSLTELAFSLAALRQNHHDVALGNILGSNIYNVLLGLGVCLWPGKVAHLSSINPIDWLLLFAYTFALYPVIQTKKPLGRWFGLLLVIPYLFYSFFLWQR